MGANRNKEWHPHNWAVLGGDNGNPMDPNGGLEEGTAGGGGVGSDSLRALNEKKLLLVELMVYKKAVKSPPRQLDNDCTDMDTQLVVVVGYMDLLVVVHNRDVVDMDRGTVVFDVGNYPSIKQQNKTITSIQIYTSRFQIHSQNLFFFSVLIHNPDLELKIDTYKRNKKIKKQYR